MEWFRGRARRWCRAVAVSLMLVCAGVGCDRSSPEVETDTGDGPNQAPAEDRAKPDSEEIGSIEVERSDDLPKRPERIVSLAPNVTETLFALGVGSRVVGRTKFCDYPERVSEVPSVGSFVQPDYERILSRRPDLVIGVISGGPRDIFEKLAGSDVPYAFLRMSTLEETFAGIRHIGRFVGAAERADELVGTMRRELEGISRKWRRRRSSRPEVLLVYGHDPIVGAGPGTFGHQLLERIGARNVLAEADTKYPRLDVEQLVTRAPDRILDTAADDQTSGREYWAGYDMVEAAQAGRVVFLTDPVVLRPGPRLPDALRRVARAVYGSREARSSTDGGVR